MSAFFKLLMQPRIQRIQKSPISRILPPFAPWWAERGLVRQFAPKILQWTYFLRFAIQLAQ